MERPNSARGDQGVKINVICRCRPVSAQDNKTPRARNDAVETSEQSSEVTIYQNIGSKSIDRTYKFDKVFGPKSAQADVYTGAISPIVKEVLEGYNCTVFAYGQTGTGKTFTMEGGDRQSDDGVNLSDVAGVIPRSIKEIFDKLEANALEYSVKVSFMELYNEELTDLLALTDVNTKLKLMEGRNGVVVQGLEETIVRNSTEIYTVLDRGSSKRRTAATLLNKVSSRSHSIFTITIHMKECMPEGDEVIKIGKLNLVDLAGSENISRSGAKESRAREAGNINQSLLTLGRVINALVEHQGHVPYRDSKLTRLLRDSLGGKTKTCIIATISPTLLCQEETLSTLDYAHRAKNIRNKPEVNQRISKHAHIKDLSIEMDRLKAELFATRDKNGVYMPVDQFAEMEASMAAKTQRIEELEGELDDTKEKLQTTKTDLETLSDEYDSTLEELEATKSELTKTTDLLTEARVHIQERDFLIAAHSRSEEALATHAENLTDELSTAALEIAGLHEKITRKEALEAEHLRVAEELQEDSSAKCSALDQEIGRNQGIQQGFHADIQSRLEQFQARSTSELEVMREQVEKLAGTVSNLQAQAAADVAAQTLSGKEALQTARGAQAEYTTAAKQAAAAAAEQATSALASLVTSLNTQKEQLQAFADSQLAASQAALESTRLTISGASAAVTVICDKAANAKESTGRHTELQKSELSSFGRSFGDAMAADADALMSNISSMISSFVTTKKGLVADAVQTACSKADEGAAEVTASLEEISEGGTSQLTALAGADSSAAASHEKNTSELQVAAGAMHSSFSSISSNVKQLGTSLTTEGEQRSQALASHGSALEELVAAISNKLDDSNAKAATEFEEISAKGKSIKEELLAAVSDSGAADRAFFESTKGVAVECSEHVNDFCDSKAADISALSMSIQTATSAIEADQPTDTTPRKRDLEVPPREWVADMRTPLHDVVLAEFRMRRSDSLPKSESDQEDEQSDPESEQISACCAKAGSGDVVEIKVNTVSKPASQIPTLRLPTRA